MPKAYDGATAAPVVITLHGLGSDGTQQLAATGWATIADRDNVVVLSPDALGKPAQWDLLAARPGNADVDFVEAMLVSVGERLCVAPRLSLNGMSSGSAFVATLTCALGDRVRVVWSRRDHRISLVAMVSRLSPVTVVAFHEPTTGRARCRPAVPDVLPIVVPAVDNAIADWAYGDGCASQPAAPNLQLRGDEANVLGMSWWDDRRALHHRSVEVIRGRAAGSGEIRPYRPRRSTPPK